MPFRLKLRRTRRYNVLSKNYFVTRIRLLDSTVIECTLSVESTGQECLEAVAQRLELRETHFFGLWFQGKTQTPAQRWVELEKPLKKQLDKFGNEPLLFFGVMFYVPNVSRLEQEVTRYQYYLQVKKEVLDGRLHCTVEQGIRLAGLAVQADFGDFTQFLSQDFLREYVLFPREPQYQALTPSVLSSRMQAAEAELLYIKEVEKLDGFGQESFSAKDNYTNDLFIGVSFIGVFAKHRNGRSIMHHKWKDIGTIAHNKSAITVEITSRDDTIIFHMEDMEMAKYVARLFTARHKFYKQNKIYSIFHDDPYCKSETSLDRCQVDFTFRNGTVPNGSMYSSPSLSSLNRSQTFIPPSPMSSNLSIPGSELMRPDYIPSHRHSAIIAPSYRPTPEYDAVMRQKRRMLPAHHDLHSQSLRSLNISNACAYRQPEALVYSQPEMRERGPYHGLGPSPGPYTPQVEGEVQCLLCCHSVMNHMSRPPPPYPSSSFRPATSTPDLASHRHRCIGGSSPELVTRMVQLSVKTFQPDSSAVVHQSLQEVSEPLTAAAKHRSTLGKRHSMEVISSMRGGGGGGMEGLVMKGMNSPPPPQPQPPPQQPKEMPKQMPAQSTAEVSVAPPAAVAYQHQKTLSNATMLIHSSESEEEEEEEEERPELDVQIPGLNEDISISAQLQAALAKLPNKPPPEYPGPPRPPGNAQIRPHPVSPAMLPVPVTVTPGLSSFLKTLERQKMSVDSMKRPLMMAALNGLYVARMPVPESPAEDGAKAATDERCKTLELKLEEERVFTEYEQVPKKRADCVLTTATLPENTERNRFRDVVPYEENRVELVPNKENNTGYINASHIKVMIRGEEWHYIATQGPLANTCADFWQMVWEQGVSVIAMVTAEEEGGRSKSHRYWPKLGSKHNSATHGKFKVTTKFRTDSGCYATTGLKVKHLLSGQERTVWHLQYTDWPEQGCPEYVLGFLSYLEEIQSVRRHTNSMLDTSKSLNPPVVVHCSAGVGRTGVVILTELMISCLEHNEPVEVPTMLSELRQQRMLMVQTISQYQFVYQVLIQFLKNSRLI
uniref:Tyrosine-protein phosphatase non-receptor type n=1 Tax=Salarias fasciatus TaxID=181472 RepID=A0A672HZ29_SALFA